MIEGGKGSNFVRMVGGGIIAVGLGILGAALASSSSALQKFLLGNIGLLTIISGALGIYRSRRRLRFDREDLNTMAMSGLLAGLGMAEIIVPLLTLKDPRQVFWFMLAGFAFFWWGTSRVRRFLKSRK